LSKVIEGFATGVNGLLAKAGLMVTRAAPSQFESWRASIGGPYRTDREVIRKAAARGLSVGDFVEEEWGKPGRSRKIVAKMRDAGAVPESLESVCEIGPGTGRYIQRIFEIAAPKHYEICEIERSRAKWLARTYPVTILPAEGETLRHSRTASIQLVHAHGVFASLKAISCFAYFEEMMRITAPNGHIVFDVICEECLGDVEVDAWLKSQLRYVNFLSKGFLAQFFEKRGFSLVSDFRFPLMIFGQSCYLIFKKTSV
jgi:hypothetical protein